MYIGFQLSVFTLLLVQCVSVLSWILCIVLIIYFLTFLGVHFVFVWSIKYCLFWNGFSSYSSIPFIYMALTKGQYRLLKWAHMDFVRVLSCLTASSLDVCALFTYTRWEKVVSVQSPVSLNQRELVWPLQWSAVSAEVRQTTLGSLPCSCCLCHVVSCPAVSFLRETFLPPSHSPFTWFAFDRPLGCTFLHNQHCSDKSCSFTIQTLLNNPIG